MSMLAQHYVWTPRMTLISMEASTQFIAQQVSQISQTNTQKKARGSRDSPAVSCNQAQIL